MWGGGVAGNAGCQPIRKAVHRSPNTLGELTPHLTYVFDRTATSMPHCGHTTKHNLKVMTDTVRPLCYTVVQHSTHTLLDVTS